MTTHELRKLAEAATPGEWEARSIRDRVAKDVEILGVFGTSELFESDGIAVPDPMNDRTFSADAANMCFIAAANPARILALLDELDSLRAPVAVSEVEDQELATRPVAVEICDAVIDWIIKHDLGDRDEEYSPSDVVSVLDDLWGDDAERVKMLEAALERVAAPGTVAGMHEQGRDGKLQSIARAALTKGSKL